MKEITKELQEYEQLSQDRRAVGRYQLTAKEAAELIHDEGGTFNAIIKAYQVGFSRGARYQAARARKGESK